MDSLSWEQEVSLEKARALFGEALAKEKADFKERGLEGIVPFLQVSLLGKNRVYSSLLCIDLVEKDGELIFKTADPVNNFTADKKMIEKITWTERITGEERKNRGVFLTFHLTGGIKSQICLSRETIAE